MPIIRQLLFFLFFSYDYFFHLSLFSVKEKTPKIIEGVFSSFSRDELNNIQMIQMNKCNHDFRRKNENKNSKGEPKKQRIKISINFKRRNRNRKSETVIND